MSVHFSYGVKLDCKFRPGFRWRPKHNQSYTVKTGLVRAKAQVQESKRFDLRLALALVLDVKAERNTSTSPKKQRFSDY